MRSPIGSLLACVALAGCAHVETTPPLAKESRIVELVGRDAVRCGTFTRMREEPQELTAEEQARAIACMATAWHEGKAFVASIVATEPDGEYAAGVAGGRERRGLYRFEQQSSRCSRRPCSESFQMQLCRAQREGEAFRPDDLCDVRWLPQQPRAPVARCEFPGLRLPADVVVLAAGNYSGRPAGFQIDDSGHEATRMDVFVHRTDKPVVLMLGAYEPAIWTVSRSEGTRLAAVFVSGYHRQAITGLDAAVPVLNSSYDNRGPCGSVYVGSNDNAQLNPAAERLFGRKVDLVYLAKDGRAVVGEPLPQGARWIVANAAAPESFRDPNAPPAGQAGIRHLVGEGLLRPATATDADAWQAAVAARESSRNVPPIAGRGAPQPPRPPIEHAYVVMGPMRYPAGLFGGPLVTFYVPKGMPRPQGNPGHSNVYDFNQVANR